MEQRIEPPIEDDIEYLKDLIAHATLLAAQVDETFTGTVQDLEILQKIIDSGKVSKNETIKLQSLGIIFGRTFVEMNKEYNWWMVEDEQGRDPAIRLGETSLLIYPQTIISKRIENDEPVNVINLFYGLIDQLNEARTTNPDLSADFNPDLT